jgi:hypothetical protein
MQIIESHKNSQYNDFGNDFGTPPLLSSSPSHEEIRDFLMTNETLSNENSLPNMESKI